MRGLLITLEGGEGVGKSTQMAFLSEYFQKKNIPFVTTREPGGTELSEQIRLLFLHQENGSMTDLLLITAARCDHFHKKIAPCLEKGQHVLCDRYIDSTLVYQGLIGGIPLETIIAFHEKAGILLWPDLTFLLEDSCEASLTRKKKMEINRFDAQDILFYRSVKESYRLMAQRYPKRYRTICTQDTPEKTFSFVRQYLESFLW